MSNNNTNRADLPQNYLNFLMDVLQIVADEEPLSILYDFLRQNLDKLDNTFINVLNVWANNIFVLGDSEETKYNIARTLVHFSRCIQELTFGKIAVNQEIAISGYNNALSFFTLNTYPKAWATIKNNLANAYSSRITGEKAENIEIAIGYLNEALTVFNYDDYPEQWATTQQNLGRVHIERIIGNKAENLERAISCCENALRVRNPDTYEWAMIQNDLGNAYKQRIEGEKSENIEIAILCHSEAQNFYHSNNFFQEWAMTQHNLGEDYRERIQGDRADNLEEAIVCNQQALTIRTFEEFPVDWALTNSNLSLVYLARIKQNKAENIEKAIASCNEALKVFKVNTFPEKWAATQTNLGEAYLIRIRGNKRDNLEMAVKAYNEALKIYKLDAFPEKWATIQYGLAHAYSYRINGDKANNLEKAIIFYKEALRVHTINAFPYQWAMIQNALGIAYSDRIRGDKKENLKSGIFAFSEALTIRTFASFPIDWGMTQNNLAVAYTKLASIYGQEETAAKQESLEKAIIACNEALTIRTFKDSPQQWALTQNNLGIAYNKSINGDRSQNIEKAIIAYNETLEVYTFDDYPKEWALTQNNLASAYSGRIAGDKDENTKKAIKFYQNALEVDTVESDPLNCLLDARNLANLHYREKQWQPATEAYQTAIEALENARLEALNPQSRQEVLSNAIDVFHLIVQAYLNLNQPEKALEYIERSKGRNLVELMTQKALKPQGVDQENIDKLAQLKQQVVNEQIRLQHQSINQNLMQKDNLTPYVQDHSNLKEYQQELDTFIAEKITPYDPTFNLTQKVQPIPFKDIQALTDDSTCLLQWYITGEKILAFIVSANQTVKVWQSSEDDRKQLFDVLNNYLQLYYSQNGKKEWIDKLPNLLQNFADILHINEIISLIPETCERLIIIPHWFLHILPLHALPISNSPLNKRGSGGLILQDKYDIKYAPSCQLLQITKQRTLNELNNFFAIQNPTKDLIFTDLEVNIISSLFNKKEVIAKEEATETTVTRQIKASESNCYHFSCHGGFNPNNPLESALLLANKDEFTLGEVFELNLKKSRLVVLSACETGLIDLNSISDEYIGLPAGFLFAGSSSVVSSLWTVSDLSTSFLMMKFYEIILDENQNSSIPVALKMAQNWLRNLTIEEFDNLLIKYESEINHILEQLISRKKLIFKKQIELIHTRGKYPFSNPYYWGAFFASGV